MVLSYENLKFLWLVWLTFFLREKYYFHLHSFLHFLGVEENASIKSGNHFIQLWYALGSQEAGY